MKLKTYPMNQSAILRLYAERDDINLSPAYQRRGDIWNLEKRQLLIDSILNEFDIPKLYFHVVDAMAGKYAVIDGRQRLESIFNFVDGRFSLSDDFEYYADPSVKLNGLTYPQIAEKHPRVKIRFDSSNLPIVLVETDDEEVIDDMFSRLNEAAPLNAAEKRNAFGGKVVSAIKEISSHRFFVDKVRFTDKRYQYREVSARILFLEHSISNSRKIFDTKKTYIDDFAKDKQSKFAGTTTKSVEVVLDNMVNVFGDKDELLRSQAMVPIFFLLFREAISQGVSNSIQRSALVQFRQELDRNRTLAESDISTANYELLEFDRLSQQGTNDASSIQKRLEILADYVGVSKKEIVYV
jgi:hypothetical protein